jgi:hypothetical protein
MIRGDKVKERINRSNVRGSKRKEIRTRRERRKGGKREE